MAKQRSFQAMASLLILMVSLASVSDALALKVGARIGSIKVKDASDNPAWIPDLGKKVVSIFYTDPDVKDQNEPFRELLVKAQLDKSQYRAVGVVNMKDTWKPNFVIRQVVQGKIKKFKSTILTDPDHRLKESWQLGDCDDKDIVIIIDKEQRVRYVKMGRMSSSEQQRAASLIQSLMKQ